MRNTLLRDPCSAVRPPYANHQEQEMIDMMTRFLETRKGAANAGVTPDQLLALLPPDVKISLRPCRW